MRHPGPAGSCAIVEVSSFLFCHLPLATECVERCGASRTHTPLSYKAIICCLMHIAETDRSPGQGELAGT